MSDLLRVEGKIDISLRDVRLCVSAVAEVVQKMEAIADRFDDETSATNTPRKRSVKTSTPTTTPRRGNARQSTETPKGKGRAMVIEGDSDEEDELCCDPKHRDPRDLERQVWPLTYSHMSSR